MWWKLVKQLSYDQMAPVTELYLKFVIIITVFYVLLHNFHIAS